MSVEEPGGFDMSQLVAQAQQMQSQLQEAQARAAEQVVEGVSGGGAVRVSVTGDYQFQKVTIDPAAANEADMLEDLILAAIRDAVTRVQELNQEALGSFGGMFS